MSTREVVAWYVAYGILGVLAGILSSHSYFHAADGLFTSAAIMTMAFGAMWVHASNRIPGWYQDRRQ